MASFLSYALFVGIAALVIVLVLGLVNLLKTDEGQPSRSNKLMRARVIVQAVIIGILVLLGVVLGSIKLF